MRGKNRGASGEFRIYCLKWKLCIIFCLTLGTHRILTCIGLTFGRKFLYCDNEMTDSCSREEEYVIYGEVELF